jgi:iron(III) transport system permease protein
MRHAHAYNSHLKQYRKFMSSHSSNPFNHTLISQTAYGVAHAPLLHVGRWIMWALLAIFALVLLLPVTALLLSWLQWNNESAQILKEISQSVLPDYAWTTLILCVSVAIGVAMIGVGAALAVTLFDFRGRKVFEWALLLPLAMPAYVVAYAYTDFLQFSGPLQTAIRHNFGLEGRVFPEVRNVAGAAWVFTFCLYPYVYLLTRTALSERAAHLMDAGRLLGATLPRRIRQIALPLARPAVAAGVALALMETLADFGVSSYFGIQTFTAGVYKAWLVMDNRIAAAQLATMLLVLVILLLKLERRAQQKMRFSSNKIAAGSQQAQQPMKLQGSALMLAWLACLIPILMGFILPLIFMLRPLAANWSDPDVQLPWQQFGHWIANSMMLGGISTVITVVVAIGLAFAVRTRQNRWMHAVAQLASVGYAIPGAVIVVGLLLAVGWLQNLFPAIGVGYWVTATAVGIVWAYVVRFSGVALQSVQSGYAKIPHSFDESARMLGTSGLHLLKRIHAPLLKRSVAAAALLVFVDVMKELPATLVLRPFNSDTLAVVAYQLARDERLGEAALPALALVLVGLLPVILLSRTLRSR